TEAHAACRLARRPTEGYQPAGLAAGVAPGGTALLQCLRTRHVCLHVPCAGAHVLELPRRFVVDDHGIVRAFDESFGEVRADEARAARNQDSHATDTVSQWRPRRARPSRIDVRARQPTPTAAEPPSPHQPRASSPLS